MLNPFDDSYFMRQAILEANKAYDANEVPVGAVVVAGNQVIGRGYNLTEKLHDVTAHAEVQALTAAANFLGAKYLKECTLYVTLEPCPMCAGALYWSQIGKVCYGASTDLQGGIEAEPCVHLLRTFFEGKR
jgi:tRNA(adenine34) deaminase